MVQGLRSWKNVPPSTVSLSKLEQPASPEGTPALNDVGPPDAPAPDAPVLAPGPAPTSTNELFKQFMKPYLEAQTSASAQVEPWEQPLKACIPDFYYGNSYINCYRFCQKCEDHIETAGANGPNRIPFAVLFLHKTVI